MKRRLFLLVAVPLLLAAILYVAVPPQPRCVIEGVIEPVSLSDDGDWLLTRTSPTHLARLPHVGPDLEWDLCTGRCLNREQVDRRQEKCWTYSPNLRYRIDAMPGEGVRIMDRSKNTCWFADCGGIVENRAARFFSLFPICFAPDSEHFFIAEKGRVTLIETASGRQLASFRGADDGVASVVFPPSRDTALLPTKRKGDGFDLLLWDIKSGEAAHSWSNVAFWRVSPGHRRLLVSCWRDPAPPLAVEAGEMEVWDLVDLRKLGIIPMDTSPETGINQLEMSRDGDTLAVVYCHREGRAEFWDLATAKRKCQVPLISPRLCEIHFAAHEPFVTLATHGWPKQLVTWNLADGQKMWERTLKNWRPVPIGFGAVSDKCHLQNLQWRGEPALLLADCDKRTTKKLDLMWISQKTGEVLCFFSMAATDFTLHGNHAASVRDADAKTISSWWTSKLRSWWPTKYPDTSVEHRLFDLTTGEEVARTHGQLDEPSLLSGDGKTWITPVDLPGKPEARRLQVWDVPQATPWRWVLGLPLAWLAAASAWLAWRRKREPAAGGRGPGEVVSLDPPVTSQP